MKNNKYIIWILLVALLSTAALFSSCTDDLNRAPDSDLQKPASAVYGKDLLAYTQSLAKIYAGLAISGHEGGDGDADVQGVDGGSQASFLRGLWNLQELPTDEAHCNWGDVGIPDFNHITWSSGNVFVKGLYYRLFYQISISNEFLRETTDSKLSGRGMEDNVQNQVRVYRADARFMRAIAYFYLLDLFRNVPLITEDALVGKDPSPQVSPQELFGFIESELKEIEGELIDPFVGYSGEYYGRVTKAAAWSLLSRLYLNAEVYIKENKYTECITYSNKVLGVGYELEAKYADMFKADNDRSKEMILPIRYEGIHTKTWGGMTFLACSTVPSALKDEINVLDAWQGNRSRESLLNMFKKISNSTSDTRRAMLREDLTTSPAIVEEAMFVNNGVPVVKYVNLKKDGSKPASNDVYLDFPLFRLAEIYLNYAEATLRGGQGGDQTKARNYINDLRARAYSGGSGSNVAAADFTLDFILDERGREFFFEAQRRTDLIRFGKFTGGSYIWPWKGGVANGKSVEEHFDIYPIPADEIGSNTLLKQNPGYGVNN